MATVADVAKEAGLSVSAAARVPSGHGVPVEETRRPVLEAARERGSVARARMVKAASTR